MTSILTGMLALNVAWDVIFGLTLTRETKTTAGTGMGASSGLVTAGFAGTIKFSIPTEFLGKSSTVPKFQMVYACFIIATILPV